MTSQRPFTLTAAAIFLIMALVHAYRLVADFDISVGGSSLPQWASGIGVAVTGLLAVMLYREARR